MIKSICFSNFMSSKKSTHVCLFVLFIRKETNLFTVLYHPKTVPSRTLSTFSGVVWCAYIYKYLYGKSTIYKSEPINYFVHITFFSDKISYNSCSRVLICLQLFLYAIRISQTHNGWRLILYVDLISKKFIVKRDTSFLDVGHTKKKIQQSVYRIHKLYMI